MTATEKNAQISALILDEIGRGLSVQEAIDAVLGSGAYEQMADDLYETLRRAH